MHSAAKLNDASILRKFELSQKEAALKSKLFSGKSGQRAKSAQRAAKETHNSTQSINYENNDPNIPHQRTIMQFSQFSSQQKDHEIEKFLSSMESEFHELNKKQVTMGMLNSQQHILKQHSEILSGTQQAITQILTVKPVERENFIQQPSAQTIASQKEMLKELITPINAQIAEIKQLYEQTREKAEAAAREVAQSKNQQALNEQDVLNLFSKMKDYQTSSADLKERAYDAQARLNNLLPENLLAIKQISNLNIQAYTDCINSLKNQLDTLQRDADKAEKELELRYQKLNSLPKPSLKLKPNDPLYSVVEYGHEGSAEVVKSLQHIDFEVSRKAVQAKLGGEFDYENFVDEVSSIANEVKGIRSTLETELQNYKIIIPSDIGLDEEEMSNDYSYFRQKLANCDLRLLVNLERMAQLPSAIDEIKARYRIPNSFKSIQQLHSHSKKVHFQTPEPKGLSYSPLPEAKLKRSHQKPEALLNLRTTPVEPPPDIRFTKIENKLISPEKIRMSETIFSQPPRYPREGEHRRRFSVESSEILEQFASTEENFANNPIVFSKPNQQSGLRITTRSEAQSQYSSPQKTTQHQYNQHRFHFNDCDEDEETFRAKAPHPKSAEKIPQAQIEKEAIFDKEILRDIKEELIRINQRIETEDRQSAFVKETQRTMHPQVAKETQQFPKKYLPGNLSAVPHLEENLSPRDVPLQLGVRPEQIPVVEAHNPMVGVTTPAFSQKLQQLIADEKQRDEAKKNELFKPVECVNIDKLIQEKQQKEGQMKLEQPRSDVSAKELTNILAENMLNLFTDAVQKINTSLANGIPSLLEKKETPKGSILELFGGRKVPAESSDQAKIKDKALLDGGVKSDNSQHEMLPIADKLALEAKLTREETEMMKYYNPFTAENQTVSRAQERRSSVPNHGQYFFQENSPKAIADYSEYCRDLESEGSSIGGYLFKSVSLSHNQSRERRASLSSNKLHSFSNEISFI